MTAAQLEAWLRRAFRVLLGLYPKGFRRACGRELEDAYVDRWSGLLERGARCAFSRTMGLMIWHSVRDGTLERWASRGRPSEKGAGGWKVGGLILDTRYALRRLRKAPGFTAVTLLALGIGIGGTTAIFSVVKGVLLDPLPYEASDELIAVWHTAPGFDDERVGQGQCLALNALYEEESRVFEEVGIWTGGRVPVMSAAGPEVRTAISVTDGVFRALRVQPRLGRLFTAEDIDPASPSAVILTHRYWREEWSADPGVVGQTILINGFPIEIIGVMPEGFRLLDEDPDLYSSLQYNRARLSFKNFNYRSLGRLREGVTMEEALADLGRLLPLAPERYPGGITAEFVRNARLAPLLLPLKEEVVGDLGNVLWVVLGGVGIVLLAAVANVANLMLVRAGARERAVAIQSAMGSPRSRVVGQFLAESITLGLMGGTLGIAISLAGLQLLRAFGPTRLPRFHEMGLDGGVLVFALSISVLAGITLGLVPLARILRADLVPSLREGGGGFSSGRERSKVRNTLVVSQLAFALVLLVGSGLMIQSLVALTRVNPGFSQPEELLTFRLTISRGDVPDPNQVSTAHELLARRLSELPGVTAVGLSTSIPMDRSRGGDPVYFEDFPLPEGGQPKMRGFKYLGGGYHEAMGNPVVAGRPIDWTDVHERARVVMITESMAREVWGEPRLAVGRRLSTGLGPGDWREIVGVVGDVRDDGMDRGPVDLVYWPMVMDDFWAETRGDVLFLQRRMTYVVRSSRVGTPGFLEEVRDAVWASYPSQPLVNLRTVEDMQRSSLARYSFTLAMLELAAAVALLLGSLGIYGVISNTVRQRTRELGLRIAVGARPGEVAGMVLRQGLILAGAGVGVGVLGVLGVTRLMEAILFGVSPLDPLTLVAASGILAAVALLASYLPARRAAEVDPMVALRTE